LSWADGTSTVAQQRAGRIAYSHADDSMRFDTAATERMRIDSSGNVGIGTTSPNYALDVSTAGTTISSSFTSDQSEQYIALKDSGTTLGHVRLGSTSGAMLFNAGNSERARIDSSGRLLVGTSSESGNAKHVVRGNTGSSTGAGVLDVGLGTTRPGSAGTPLGYIRFTSTSNTSSNYHYAAIHAESDGTSSSDTDIPGRLVLSTTADGASSPTERMRIGSNGFTKLTNDSSYLSTSGNYHEMRSNTADWTTRITNSHGSIPYGLAITYSVTPNGVGSEFLYCNDSTGQRASIRSNGGIVNYQSNNVNLCDEREKKNIEALESTWGCLKNWELKKFHYSQDDDTDDKRYGVIAQQVAPHCPEVITEWVKQDAADAVIDEDGNVVTPAKEEIVRMGVKEQQMMWMAIKALQEAQERIETLEQRLTDAGL